MSRHLARSCARCLPSGLPSQGDTVPCAPLSPNGLTHPPQPCRRREGGMPGPPALSRERDPSARRPPGAAAGEPRGMQACPARPPEPSPSPWASSRAPPPSPRAPSHLAGPQGGRRGPRPEPAQAALPAPPRLVRRPGTGSGRSRGCPPGVPAGSGGRTGRARRRVPRGKRVVPEATLGGAGPASVRSAGRRVCRCGSAW